VSYTDGNNKIETTSNKDLYKVLQCLNNEANDSVLLTLIPAVEN